MVGVSWRLDCAFKKDDLLRELNNLWKNKLYRTIFLVVLVILGVVIFQEAVSLILKTPYPLHTPISRSMEPTLKVGDLLIIQGGLRAEDIHASPDDGDIIIFRDPRNPDGIPIVHRAIGKYRIGDTWYIVTKGDNNAFPDDWSRYFPKGWAYKGREVAGHPESYLIGKVIAAIPLLGYVLRFLDETQVHLGGYSVTLRTVIIVLLIAAFFLLEYTNSPERTKKTDETDLTNKEEDLQGNH